MTLANRGIMHLATVGVVVVPILFASNAGAQPARVTATVEITFGASNHPDSLLQQVGDVARGANGQTIVVDALARNLKVFDSTGVLQRIIGRRGNGPGEFGLILRAEVTRDGRIFVSEGGRLQSFSPTGELIASTKIAPLGEVPAGYALSNEGVVHQATVMFTLPLDLRPVRDSARMAERLTGRAAQANLIDSLIRVRSFKPNGDSTTLFLSTASAPLEINQMAVPLWSRNGSGTMVVSSGAKPAFRFYSPEGRFLREIPAPASWRPTPVTPDDLDVLLAKYGESMPAESREMLIASVRRRRLGSAYPAYVAMILADDESIWVRPPVTAADIRAGRVKTFDLRQNLGLPEWHVISSSGVMRMRVAVPQGFNLRRVVGDRLYGDALNANDEPVVQILKVPVPRAP